MSDLSDCGSDVDDEVPGSPEIPFTPLSGCGEVSLCSHLTLD